MAFFPPPHAASKSATVTALPNRFLICFTDSPSYMAAASAAARHLIRGLAA